MGIQVSAMFICILVFTVNRMLVGAKNVPSENVTSFNRHSFPKGFVFGTGSASYQYEGGANEGGKGPSIWDTFTHQHPEKIKDRSNGDIALDSYHLYKEDVKTMTNMNVDAYRFSISWSRIIPTGRIKDGVNKVGIQYYNNLINLLLSKGVQPYGTIFHWDVPQGLEDEYLGFLSPRIVKDFEDFADLCFKEFGDRIKHWITLNEPITFSRDGYSTGVLAPGRCSSFLGNCTRGDSSTEPYGVAHNLLLSHAAAVKLYKKTYQVSQKGQIGITNFCSWLIPLTKSQADKDAAQRALDFLYGWFMHPIVYGEYPMSMQMLVGNRQPKFTKEQSKMLKGSYDFIGVNYYTSYYVSHAPPNGAPPSYGTDSQTTLTAKKNGILIGAQSASSWIYVYPRGIKDLLVYTKELYKNPTLYITENGVNDINNSSLSLEESLQDHKRIDYHSRHLQFLLDAIKEGVNVKGYFGWSLLDNFEWGDGYTIRFGINYVDYKNGLKRYPKSSALWFRKFLKR